MSANGLPHKELKPIATWVVSVLPLIALAVFVMTALHVRLALGHWPMAVIDSPPTVLLRLNIFLFAGAFIFAMFAAVPLWLVLMFFRSLRLSLASHVLQAATLAIGLLALFWVPMAVDPKYVTWFLD